MEILTAPKYPKIRYLIHCLVNYFKPLQLRKHIDISTDMAHIFTRIVVLLVSKDN